MDEAHLSTKRAEAGEDPRLSQADVDEGRPGGDPVAPGEGTSTPVGVMAGTTSVSGPMKGLTPIRSRHTFEELRRTRSRGRAGPLTVAFVPQNAWSGSEVAYAINRQVGNAVTRNRLRRRLRSILAGLAPSLPAGAFLVRTGPDAPQLAFDELKVAMSRALGQATRRAGDQTTVAGTGGEALR
jgi:ribonuclease P protein component